MSSLHNEIRNWMVMYKEKSVKPSTYDRMLTSLKLMDNYVISEIDPRNLKTSDIQDYVNRLVDDNYALSTIKKQYHLIGAFVEYANLTDLISKPIHKGVRLPSESVVKKSRKDVFFYSTEEQKALKRILFRADSPAYNVALIMLETGMRVGEALALCWSDVDWRRRAVRISKTVVRIADQKRSYVQQSAKSYTSNRTIPLSKEAYDLLTWMKQTDQTDQTLSDFIFHDENGRRISYEALRWWTKKACDEAGVPYYGQHVFRHTFASNCYQRGCDVKKLSKLLGHSDVTITYNVYIHLFGDELEELRSVLE